MSDAIQFERERGLLTLRFNRPDKKNALTRAMYSHLAEALKLADTDPEINAVLITGTAECFTAGNDIADFIQQPPGNLDSPVFQFMLNLLECRKPVIAAVAGAAVGIGTTMLLHCDLVYVSRDARLRMPFVNLGLCPEFGSSLLLPRLLGHARAARLLLCNELLTGEQAVEWGLANELHEDGEQCLAAARKLAERLQALPQDALRISKRLLKDAHRQELEVTVQREGLLFIERLHTPEAKAALRALVKD